MKQANKQRNRCLSLLVLALFFAGTAYPEKFSEWSQPVNLGANVNSTAGDFFACISKDGLSLYFTSSRLAGFGGWDIYVSKRATTSSPWGLAQNLGPEINTAFNEGAPSLSVDGHTMYFASNRSGGFGGNDLYVSRRHNKRDDFGWQAPANLGGGVNTGSNEASPAIFEDDETGVTTLYFDSNRPDGLGPFTSDAAGNGNDIYSSILQADGTFGSATLITELSTPSRDRQPSISHDGLEMYLVSDRPGTLGFLDLWVATRASTLDVWSEPVNLGAGLNTSGDDAGPAISFDGTTLYFHSVRVGDNFGAFDLYAVTRTKLKGGKSNDD